MDKATYLTKLYYDVGRQQTDFRVTSTFEKDGETLFNKWNKYLDVQADENKLNKITHREQLKNEIVFDLDEGKEKEYLELIERLKKDNIKFYAYATKGFRARHIHTFWKGLANLSKTKREKIRERILGDFGCDISLKNDAHVIALENFKHYKTGEIIKLLDKVEGINNITPYVNILEAEERERKESKISLIGLRIDNFLQNVEQFYETQPFFYDKSGIFWFWNNQLNKYELVDDVDLMIELEKQLDFNGQTINSSIKTQYIESFKRVGRLNIPKESPDKWIQFRDKAFSIKSKNMYDVKPNYFFTNPIPWEVGDVDKTPMLDKLFKQWVGEEYTATLYELIAYCCFTNYPIQTIFCLYGDGRNGKSSFLKILSTFIGKDNVCSTELDLLVGNSSSRFESFKLYKKLVCLMGETNFGMMNKSSLLKKLTGGDMIGFEMKGKKPFDDYSYAKMIIASNSLPTSEDTSEGFYRRWLIIDFPNKFPEGKDITEEIPEREYNNLARKVVNIISQLLDIGMFTNQGDINERKFKYVMASNPLPMFINQFCNKGDDEFILYNELYTQYIRFLKVGKKRRVSRKEFRSSLEDEGFWIEKASKRMDTDEIGDDVYKSGLFIDGLSLNLELLEKYDKNPTQLSYRDSNRGNCHKVPKVPKEEEKTIEETIK